MTLSAYCGVDLKVTSPCRCGCTLQRVHPHSTKSETPFWKCAWCRVRVARVIKEHDAYLKKRDWYDIITATLDENWVADGNDEFDSESGDDAV